MTRIFKATFIVTACTVLAGCSTGSTTKVAKSGGVTTTVVTDSQWLVILLTAATALVSALLTAGFTAFYSSRAEADKRGHEQRTAREKRVREQIAEVAQGISALMLEIAPEFRRYEEGTDPASIDAMEAAGQIAIKHDNQCLGKVQVLEDAELRRRAETVFRQYVLVTHEMAESLMNHTAAPQVTRIDGARNAFFERAREVIAAL